MVTKEMIKNSMEAKYRKSHLKICLIMYGVALFGVFGVWACNEPFSELFREVGAYIVAFGLLGCYDGIRYLMLFWRRKSYGIYEVLLDRPTSSWIFKGCVYFTITIELKSGIGIIRRTKAMWSDHPFSKFKAWEYMNSKIHIAYDEERDKMIILGSEGDYERDNSNE